MSGSNATRFSNYRQTYDSLLLHIVIEYVYVYVDVTGKEAGMAKLGYRKFAHVF